MAPLSTSCRQASSSATYPPVIAAQRVPPSAARTSQSAYTVRSPSAAKSTTPRIDRPIRRWISTVRPSRRPRVTSRCLRSPVEAGSIPYSAVSQPRPWPASHFGTDSCTEAVQITRVPPGATAAQPGPAPPCRGVARRHQRDVAPERALEHRRHERVMGAAEDDRVDGGRAQWLAVRAHGVHHTLVEGETALDDRGEVRA